MKKLLAVLLAALLFGGVFTVGASAAAAPGTPRNLKLVPGDTAITVEWDAPDDGGGAVIVGYNLEFSAGTDKFQESTDGAARSCTRKFLTNGTEYTVKVWAFNGLQSEIPAEGKCTPGGQPVVAPGVPRNLKLTPGDKTIHVEWDAPESDGGKPITRYLIQFAIGSDSIAVVEADGSARSFLKDILVNGQLYTVRVWAFNGAQSDTPAEGTCTPIEPAPPPPPSIFATIWNFIVKWVFFGWLWRK